MILPCIDLMDGKVVQLVQGRDKALEGDAPLEMLRRFAAFPEIQVIDLDAAMGKGENSSLVELLASRAKSAGVDTVVFDRGGNKYHGRVAALAEGAREGGLAF